MIIKGRISGPSHLNERCVVIYHILMDILVKIGRFFITYEKLLDFRFVDDGLISKSLRIILLSIEVDEELNLTSYVSLLLLQVPYALLSHAITRVPPLCELIIAGQKHEFEL